MKTVVFITLGVVVLLGAGVLLVWVNRSGNVIPTPPTTPTISSKPLRVGEYQIMAKAIFGGDVSTQEKIEKTLPADVFIRDIEPLPDDPDTYLVIYIRNPIFDPDPDLSILQDGMLYFSCPEMTRGQAISGEYHLDAYQLGRVGQVVRSNTNDVVLDMSAPFGERTTSLEFRNTKYNADQSAICKSLTGKQYSMDEEERACGLDRRTLTVVKILKNFADYTGDGLKHEFIIRGEQSPCGHIIRAVAGYRVNEAVVYPIEVDEMTIRFNHDNFVPDSNGRVQWQLRCGDHGNDLEHNKLFEFSSSTQSYLLKSFFTKPCE